jgi:hypothetical protein
MPITGPSSYISTTQQFITHWTAVDIAMGSSGPLVLPDGMTESLFSASRTALIVLRDAVEDKDTETSIARVTLEMKKEWLHERLNLFNEAVRGKIPQSEFARVLSAVPGISDGQEVFTKPMKETRRVWQAINATPPPQLGGVLVLKDNTTLDEFGVAITALGALYDAVTNSEKDLSIALAKRDDEQDVLYAAMKQYRVSVPAGDALIDTIPRLTPEGGRTPEPVELAGAYDAVNHAADLSWGLSSDVDLEEYEVRVSFGPTWSDSNNHIVGTVPAGGARVMKTTKGLLADGAVATFKAFVRLKSGGEAGSNAVAIARPA